MNITPQIRDESTRCYFMAYDILMPVDPDIDFFPNYECFRHLR